MASRSFSSQFEDTTSRSVDNDAPLGLRQEYVDAVYFVFERAPRGFDERRLHNIIVQSLGIQPSGTPYGGFRYAIGREVKNAPWQRFYDLIIRVAAEIPVIFRAEYRQLVNQLLASYRIAWELGEDEKLHRVLPGPISSQVESVFRELGAPCFAAALASFREGMTAYDDRPQRAKDACKNIFDALEATAKIVGQMPTSTFGNVLAEIRKAHYLSSETIASLQKLYDPRGKPLKARHLFFSSVREQRWLDRVSRTTVRSTSEVFQRVLPVTFGVLPESQTPQAFVGSSSLRKPNVRAFFWLA